MDEYECITTTELRSNTKNILDGTRFLGHRYIVTRNNIPTAQLIPPDSSDEQDLPRVPVTDLRMKTRELMDAVYQGQSFLILRHDRADALFRPLGPTLLGEVLAKEKSSVAGPTEDSRAGVPILKDMLPA